MSCPDPKFSLANFKPFYCFVRFCSECSHSWSKPKTIFIRIFRVLHTVQFSRNFVSLSLLFSAATRLFYHTVSGLSRTFLTFLKKFFLHKLKRRRRDLNPRAATNDLLPFQGSPFNHLGTSALVDSRLAFLQDRYSVLHQELISLAPQYS